MGMLTLLVQVVLPLLVGLITKMSESSRLKAILLLGLTAGNQLVMLLIGHDPHDLKTLVLNTVVGFVVSVGMYYGLLKPTGAANKAQSLGRKD